MYTLSFHKKKNHRPSLNISPIYYSNTNPEQLARQKLLQISIDYPQNKQINFDNQFNLSTSNYVLPSRHLEYKKGIKQYNDNFVIRRYLQTVSVDRRRKIQNRDIQSILMDDNRSKQKKRKIYNDESMFKNEGIKNKVQLVELGKVKVENKEQKRRSERKDLGVELLRLKQSCEQNRNILWKLKKLYFENRAEKQMGNLKIFNLQMKQLQKQGSKIYKTARKFII